MYCQWAPSEMLGPLGTILLVIHNDISRTILSSESLLKKIHRDSIFPGMNTTNVRGSLVCVPSVDLSHSFPSIYSQGGALIAITPRDPRNSKESHRPTYKFISKVDVPKKLGKLF